MIRLYIDFDGVVMDSIPPLYDALEKSGANVNKEEEIREFFANYDYNNVVNDKLLLNDSRCSSVLTDLSHSSDAVRTLHSCCD